MTSLPLAVLVLLALLVYKTVSSIRRSRRLASLAQAHGCQPPHNLSGNWPWPISTSRGIRTLIRLSRMHKTGEDMLDDIIPEQFRDANTISQIGFDGSIFMVCCNEHASKTWICRPATRY